MILPLSLYGVLGAMMWLTGFLSGTAKAVAGQRDENQEKGGNHE
jgi:hypothetical protein